MREQINNNLGQFVAMCFIATILVSCVIALIGGASDLGDAKESMRGDSAPKK